VSVARRARPDRSRSIETSIRGPETTLEGLAKLKPIRAQIPARWTAGQTRRGVNDGRRACDDFSLPKAAVKKHGPDPPGREILGLASAAVAAAHHGHRSGAGDAQN